MNARIETTRFRVEGMDCASCAMKVDTAARRVAGVEDVSVSVMNGTMSVRHSAQADLQTVAGKVTNLGYPTKPIRSPEATESQDQTTDLHLHGNSDHDEDGPWWRTRKAMLTLSCGAALLLAFLLPRAHRPPS